MIYARRSSGSPAADNAFSRSACSKKSAVPPSQTPTSPSTSGRFVTKTGFLEVPAWTILDAAGFKPCDVLIPHSRDCRRLAGSISCRPCWPSLSDAYTLISGEYVRAPECALCRFASRARFPRRYRRGQRSVKHGVGNRHRQREGKT
jgi:hypothetical protein